MASAVWPRCSATQQPRRRRPGLLVEPAAAGVRVRPRKPGTGPEARPDRRPSLPSRHTSATPPPPGPRHRGPRRPRAGWYTRRSCQPSLVTLPGLRQRSFAAVLARPGALPGTVHQARDWAGRTSAAVTRDTAGLAGCATSSPRSAVLAPMPGPGGKVTCARGQWLPGAGWAVDGRHHRALRRGPGAARPAGEGGQECGRAACDVLPPGAPGPASRAGQRIAPGLVVQVGEPRLGQGLNDGVSRHRGLLGAVDLVAVRSTWLRHRQPAVPAGRGERDCRAVLLPARSLARASALARTTSGSRGSGGSTSCQGRSRRTLGRWIRICATFLISSASHPSVGTREAGPTLGNRPSGAVYGETRSSVGTVLRGTIRAAACGGRHPKVHCQVESSATGATTKVPPDRGPAPC